MNRETWKVTLALLAVMALCVIAINMVPQREAYIPATTGQALDEAGLVERVHIWPGELVVDLSEAVSIRSGGDRIRTRSVGLMRSDSTRTLEEKWDELGLIESTHEAPREHTDGGVIFVVLLGVGLTFVVLKARKDHRDGSVRKQIEDLKRAYDRGDLSENEYSQRLAELMPQL